MMIKADVHDLVKLKSVDESHFDLLLPSWALKSLCGTPYAVVRRGRITQFQGVPYLPIGIRGESRENRFGVFMTLENVEKVISPQQIVKKKFWLRTPGSDWSILLEQLDKTLQKWAHSLEWGPGGSIGFELVTGRRVTTKHSDIDLVVKPNQPLSLEEAGQLVKELQECMAKFCPVVPDITMLTGRGWVSLAEYAAGSGVYLVKTEAGEELVQELWPQGENMGAKGSMV